MRSPVPPPEPLPRSVSEAVRAAVAAGLRVPGARLRRGPLVPSWSLAYESRVAVLRAACRFVFGTDDARAARQLVAFGALGTPAARGVPCRRAALGGLPCEWAEPPGARDGVLLCLHGGGLVVGSPATERWLTTRLARDTSCRVAAPVYRLAPEHPYPAALDDAVAAYEGLLAAGVAPGRIVLAGASAGGGLVLALLLRLRDAGRPLPAGAALLSPWTDLSGQSESLATNDGLDYLERWYLPICAGRYAADDGLRHPYVSPVFGDLAGLPPLLVQVGGVEVIRDDGVRAAAVARAAGVSVRLTVWPDEVHVWHQLAGLHEPADRALAEVAAFVRERLAGYLAG
jgi:acetyl esterase/lipase